MTGRLPIGICLIFTVVALGAVPDPGVTKLIVQLGSPSYEARNAAAEELVRIGKPALKQIAAARNHEDPEVALRAAGIYQKITGQYYEIDFDDRTYFIGEAIPLTFTIVNPTGEPLRLAIGGRYVGGRDGRFRSEAQDKHGRALDDPVRGPMVGGGIGGVHAIEPGERWGVILNLSLYAAFTQPGVYDVEVHFDTRDFEPRDDLIPPQVVNLNVTVREPTAEEVKARVAASAEVKKRTGPVPGNVRQNHDYRTLYHPAYLPVLADRLAGDDRESARGVDAILTVPATKLLAERLAATTDRRVRDLCFNLLINRLPFADQPPWETRYEVPPAFRQQRDSFVTKVYDPSLQSLIRQTAATLLKGDTNAANEGLRLLGCVGTADDVPMIVAHADRSIEAWQSTTDEDGRWLREMEFIGRYGSAINRVMMRRAKPPAEPRSPIEWMMWFCHFAQQKPDARSDDWQQRIWQGLKSDSSIVRWLALRCLPTDAPADMRRHVLGVMRSGIRHDRLNAIDVAQRFADPMFGDACVDWLRQSKDDSEFMVGVDTALASGIGRDKIADVLIDRIGELKTTAVRLLARVSVGEVIRYRDMTEQQVHAAQPAWRTFIDEHRKTLAAGDRVSLTDPSLNRTMLPEPMLIQNGGHRWPDQAPESN